MGILPASSLYCDDPRALEEAVARHLLTHRLLRGVSHLGVAVSGGADSVALLHLLAPVCRDQGVRVTVLHLDHGLRAESAADADFVRALASSLGLPCRTERLRLAKRETDGASLEMAARAARQAFFARSCAADGLDAVATGHQADDVAETLLLRLARGAGASGLAALRPRARPAPALLALAGRPFTLIRPLLPASAHALRDWLHGRGIAWREDASNRSCDIPRNLVRHRVLPGWERALGLSLRPGLCRTAEILREEDAYLEELAARRLRALCEAGALDTLRLLRQHEALRRRILRLWLFDGGAGAASGFECVSRLIDLCRSGGGEIQLSDDLSAHVSGNRLQLHRKRPEPAEASLSVPGRARFGAWEVVAEPHVGVCADAHGVGASPAACAIGAEALAGRVLLVRARRPGDRLRPTGMKGSKKLHDLFVDAKVPKHARSTIPVLACGDEVVWVPGSRVSQRFAVPAPEAPSIRITARLLASECGAPASRGLLDSSGLEGKTGSQPKRRPGR